MSQSAEDVQPAEVAAGIAPAETSSVAAYDGTDTPIPLWPEGVLVVLAGITLLVVGMRHRTYIQRKVTECQRALDEFQRQGGLDDVQQVARQASEFLKGSA